MQWRAPAGCQLVATVLTLLPAVAKYLILLAGELGFEPRFSESESDVLPLNYSPAGQETIELHRQPGGITWGNSVDLTSP